MESPVKMENSDPLRMDDKLLVVLEEPVFTMDEYERMNLAYDESDDDEQSFTFSDSMANKEPEDPTIVWSEVSGNLHPFTFDQICGFNTSFTTRLPSIAPIDFYKLFVDDSIVDRIVEETNRYAEQEIIDGIVKESIKPSCRLSFWVDVTKCEILKFLGIVTWMGLVQQPKLRDYWSRNVLYQNEVSRIMSRNRFEAILSHFSFTNNEGLTKKDHMQRIAPLIDLMNDRFQQACIPGKDVFIDELMVPFQERFSYHPKDHNNHKTGMKLFKLCVEGGYTYNMVAYEKKEKHKMPPNPNLANYLIIMKLINPILDVGRTLYTDMSYTSMNLAYSLLQRRTHLIGMLHPSRINNPTEITKKQLQNDEFVALESNTNIIIGKWRDACFLTTKSVPTQVEINRSNRITYKPSTICEFNQVRTLLDASDLKASVRKGSQWFQKLGFDILTNITVVNAYFMYRKVTGANIDKVMFREKIVASLLGITSPVKVKNLVKKEVLTGDEQHELVEAVSRGRCVLCYETLTKENGREFACSHARKVTTTCKECKYKYLCLPCFFKSHRCTKA